ncbi:hypothetical protein [Polaribacter aestuariivivens]|uniref:hypothetical protein n=1 Tax=Polaribacter aestuariivivens TaxID=2304626 RepID=UPI003F496BEA
MKKYLLLSFLIISFFTQGQTKSYKTLDEVRNNTKNISNFFIKKNYADLFNSTKPYWGLKANEIDSLIVKTQAYQEFFDQRLGYGINAVKVKEQNLENTLFKETYILRYEKSALRITLVYYKNDSGWVINYFNWDDKFLEELN